MKAFSPIPRQVEAIELTHCIWHWLLVIGLSGFIPTNVLAQYRFDNWTTEQGLPQNSVLAITQTRDGYLWLATLNGLVRFDGLRFTVFDKNNTPAFQTSRFHELYEDADGTLWIGTIDSGVLRYQNGTFTAFTQAQGLPDNQIREIQRGVDGTPLLVADTGAVWWRKQGFAPYEFSGKANDVQYYLARSGTHWIADNSGLHAHKDGRITSYVLPLPAGALQGMRMSEDRSGSVWVATARNGVFRIKDGQVTDYTARLQNKALKVFSILEDRDGSLWFSTLDSGLIHFRDVEGETATVYTMAEGLSSNAVRGLCQDREGTLWVGTGGGGLMRLTRQFITGYSETERLSGNIAHAVLADHAGAVWVATQAGLSRIEDGAITNYLQGNTVGSLQLRGLQALHEDRNGRLWLGGWDGLCSFKDGVFSAPLRQGGKKIPKLNIWAIHEDRAGNLWLGTHFGLLKIKDGNLTEFTKEDGLPHNTIRVIHEDRQGNLWFGTEGGLVKREGERFTVFTTKNGLVNDRIWSMHEDADGVFWLGTFDGGLSRFKDGRFTNYTTAQGLYNNGVFQILEDGNGYLWMSCFRGLYRASKQQLNDYAEGKVSAIISTAFGKADGMLSADCNGGRQPSGVKTADGRMWFTTLRGVAVVNAGELKSNVLAPPVLLESATLDRASADITNGLRIAPGQANLEISYTALSFIKAEQIRFKYQLSGQDPDWIEVGTRRTANYSYLRPGSYTFKVIAANSDGVWNTAGAQLRVTVLPAFYQTWWFRALALLSLVSVIGLFFKRRLDQANRARRVQEEFSRRLIDSQEQERKRIAAELHDSLGQNLLVIKNYALMGLNTANDGNPLREHLDEISEAASQSLAEVRQISHNLRPYQLERLGLTQTLETMLRQIANASDIGFTWEVERIDGLFAQEDEISIYRIVQEALNNILKHSEANEASVWIKHLGDAIQLTITDNGRGFTVEPANHAELQKRGLGLTGTAERVRILGGQMVIQSAPGQGTQLHITLKPNIHHVSAV